MYGTPAAPVSGEIGARSGRLQRPHTARLTTKARRREAGGRRETAGDRSLEPKANSLKASAVVLLENSFPRKLPCRSGMKAGPSVQHAGLAEAWRRRMLSRRRILNYPCQFVQSVSNSELASHNPGPKLPPQGGTGKAPRWHGQKACSAPDALSTGAEWT